MEHYIIYTNHDVIWCYEEEAKEKLKNGWSLYTITKDEARADDLVEMACYSVSNPPIQ